MITKTSGQPIGIVAAVTLVARVFRRCVSLSAVVVYASDYSYLSQNYPRTRETDTEHRIVARICIYIENETYHALGVL